MSHASSILAAVTTVLAAFALSAIAQTPTNPEIVGDAERGEQEFEATCAECHGAAATAPTLRGVIGRPIASVASFSSYSDALKAKSSMKWTKENLNIYLTSPRDFAPGNLMFREFPDAQMRADVIAYLETLPPPR
jgi:cytochrome c